MVLAAFLSVILTGCGGNPPPQAQPHSPQLGASSKAATGANTASRGTSPSGDAEWTILAHTIRTANHIAESKRLKEDLIASTPLKDWYLVHGDSESQLFHGYYRSYEGGDAAAAQARADLAGVREVKDVRGVSVFRNAAFAPIHQPEPEAPAEWNLANSGGYWSLQIAAYQDHPDRKQAAIDSVREARAQGIEAYYYHGDRVSSVCVGAWPREAFEQGEAVANKDSRKRVVVTNQNLPEAVAEAMEEEGERKNELVLTNQGRVKDKRLEAMMRQYPYHFVNDDISVSKIRNPNTGMVTSVPDPSFLVTVPTAEPNVLNSQVVQDRRQTNTPRRQVDVGEAIYGERRQPAPTEQGRLRSIGE